MSKEFKIGLIALISGATLYFGFNFLKGIDFLSTTTTYHVMYENVDGLTKSNPVVINGLSVGKVSDIKLLQSRENLILVELTITDDIVLGDSAVAELKDLDILGGKAIVLQTGDISKPLNPGDTLNAYVDRGLAEYLDSVQPITNNLSITISRINEILLGLQGSGEKINITISELNTTLGQVNGIIENNKQEWSRTLTASRELIENVNDQVEKLDPILTNTNRVLDSLANLEISQTLVNVNGMLKQVTELLSEIDNGEGTLGKLANNDSLYNNLNKLLVDLDQLTIHFNQYPRDFLKPLGRKHDKLEGIDGSNP